VSAHLSFKTGAKDPERKPTTFDVDGEMFSLVPNPSDMPILALARLGNLDDQSEDPAEIAAVLGAISDFFVSTMEPPEWQRFYRFTIKRGLKLTDLMPIIQGLVPEVLGRPTQPPADSPPSPSSTMTTSTDDSRLAAVTQVS